MYKRDQVLGRKEILDVFETKNSRKDQITKQKRREKELDNNSNSTFRYVSSDLMSRIIKSFRGEKKRQKESR